MIDQLHAVQETAAPSAAKPLPAPRNAWYRDLTHCRLIVHLLFKHMRFAMEEGDEAEAAPAVDPVRHAQLFGTKGAISEAAVTLSHLLMKLHAFERETRPEMFTASAATPLTEEDIAIIKRYVGQP
ncbi:MAG: hypothetical protein JO089_03305 [Alphaproteobacteria bacterium]|nr:hypothetical protein [Alphaproteobacteria bacterium]